MGHASDREAATGCTVVLGPFRAAVDIRGLASGTRQLDSLSPNHIAGKCDALLLTGGSAHGLAAADGVSRWLEERGHGFPTDAGRVPIVPSAVIFDLGEGDAAARPDAATGRQACEAADRSPVEQGRVGAGTGATVGKLLGRASAMPGGLGSYATEDEGFTVAALAVVNAFGDVLDVRGNIIAGARSEDGDYLDTAAYIREHGAASNECHRAPNVSGKHTIRRRPRLRLLDGTKAWQCVSGRGAAGRVVCRVGAGTSDRARRPSALRLALGLIRGQIKRLASCKGT